LYFLSITDLYYQKIYTAANLACGIFKFLQSSFDFDWKQFLPKKHNITKRDTKIFNQDNFLHDINEIKWKEVLQIKINIYTSYLVTVVGWRLWTVQ
jgi:hypothetical protein